MTAARYLDRHPVAALLLVFLAFAITGTMDFNDAEKSEQSNAAQLTTLCAQPWPDAPGVIEAKRRACRVRKQS